MEERMPYEICTINHTEFSEIIDLWEASVRATHHFLKEEDIAFFRPLVSTNLSAMHTRCVRNAEGKIAGFLGVAEDTLEMLFVHPSEFGKGVGKALLLYAMKELHVHKVDVNEDNVKAVQFYQHVGFRTFKWSALDGTGKPYPILHMSL